LPEYVALLRGINVGGSKPIKMEALRGAFVSVTIGEVCSTIDLSPRAGTTELMRFIDKEFSRENTTRNWNTVLKILDKMTGSSG